MTTIMYQQLTKIKNHQSELTHLLKRCVDDGASLGFLPQEPIEQIEQYWQRVNQDVEQQQTFLWIAIQDGRLIGTVQLVRATKANARHRAEIEKLMVHPDARQQGIAYKLLELAEQQAKALGLKLLILDTRSGDVSEKLYLKYGFQHVGVVPQFALSHTGERNATSIFYKLVVETPNWGGLIG